MNPPGNPNDQPVRTETDIVLAERRNERLGQLLIPATCSSAERMMFQSCLLEYPDSFQALPTIVDDIVKEENEAIDPAFRKWLYTRLANYLAAKEDTISGLITYDDRSARGTERTYYRAATTDHQFDQAVVGLVLSVMLADPSRSIQKIFSVENGQLNLRLCQELVARGPLPRLAILDQFMAFGLNDWSVYYLIRSMQADGRELLTVSGEEDIVALHPDAEPAIRVFCNSLSAIMQDRSGSVMQAFADRGSEIMHNAGARVRLLQTIAPRERHPITIRDQEKIIARLSALAQNIGSLTLESAQREVEFQLGRRVHPSTAKKMVRLMQEHGLLTVDEQNKKPLVYRPGPGILHNGGEKS